MNGRGFLDHHRRWVVVLALALLAALTTMCAPPSGLDGATGLTATPVDSSVVANGIRTDRLNTTLWRMVDSEFGVVCYYQSGNESGVACLKTDP